MCDINKRIPERKENKEQEKKKKMTQNFLKLMSKIKPKIQETQKTPNRKKKKSLKAKLSISFINYKKSKLKNKS